MKKQFHKKQTTVFEPFRLEDDMQMYPYFYKNKEKVRFKREAAAQNFLKKQPEKSKGYVKTVLTATAVWFN